MSPCNAATGLLSLPEELVNGICEHLEGNYDALYSLIFVSKRFYRLAEPALYKTVHAHSLDGMEKLQESLKSRPNYAQTARVLHLYAHKAAVPFSPWVDLTRRFPRLKELLIVLPYPHCSNDEHDPSTYQVLLSRMFNDSISTIRAEPTQNPQPLQVLTKLELYCSGNRKSLINIIDAAIFALPALLDLTISHAWISRDALTAQIFKRKTPLKKLALIEVHTNLIALSQILSMPKALETLVLHLGCVEDRLRFQGHIVDLCCRDPITFFAAIALQESSLESLEYTPSCDGTEYINLPSNFTGLSSFGRLTTLTLGRRSHAFEASLTSSANTVPPNLKRVAVSSQLFAPARRGCLTFREMFEQFASIADEAPGLKTCRLELLGDEPILRKGRERIEHMAELLGEYGVAFELARKDPPQVSNGRPDLSTKEVFNSHAGGWLIEHEVESRDDDDDGDWTIEEKLAEIIDEQNGFFGAMDSDFGSSDDGFDDDSSNDNDA